MVKILTENNIRLTDDDLVKIDGITTFRKVVRDGIIYLQFCDKDRMRSNCRGTRYVEIPLADIINKLS